MFYYSIESKTKVVHYEGCHHLKNIKKENLRSFDNIKEFRSSEYRICSCCSPITEHLKYENYNLFVGYFDYHAYINSDKFCINIEKIIFLIIRVYKSYGNNDDISSFLFTKQQFDDIINKTECQDLIGNSPTM